MSNLFRGGWITCTKQYFGELPIRTVDFSNSEDSIRYERVVELVEAMLRLHKDSGTVKTPREKEAIERQIAATDEQVDQLVYEWYGLTDEEIRIVEGATQG